MEIRGWTPERCVEVFDLLRVCLGERETARRDDLFWKWKHEASPFGGSMILIGEEEGQYVGLRAFMRWRFAAGDRSVPAVRAVDTVTHPIHQHKGIFTRLTRAGLDAASLEGAGFVFNTPNTNSMPGYLKMGWEHVARLPMYVRVLRPMRFFVRLAAAKLLGGKTSVNRTELGAGQELTAPGATTMAALLESTRGVDELIECDATLRGPGLTTARSAAFLHWRYAQHPYVPYYAESAELDGRLAGVLVWRLNVRNGLREVMVCDLLLATATVCTVRQLLRCVIQKARGDYVIAHFGDGAAHLDLLRNCLFWRLPGQGMNFTVRRLGHDVTPDPLKQANWALCLGDLEIF